MVVAALFFLYVLIYAATRLLTPEKKEYEQLSLPPAMLSRGVMDPSLAANNMDALLALSSFEPGNNGVNIRTRLLRGKPPHCKYWDIQEGGFETRAEKLLAADGKTVLGTGQWRVETPAVVYDPADVGREWKFFAYKYFWPDGAAGMNALTKSFSLIVYKHADKDFKKWSTEDWLFSSSPDVPPMPYTPLVREFLNTKSPDLKNIRFYARPSVVYDRGALVMSLSAFENGQTPASVIMLVSVDHGKNWSYIGTVLKQADAAKLGAYTHIAGASLLKQGDKVYLAVTPGHENISGDGAFIIPFESPARAQLQRDKSGAPVVIQHIPLRSAEPSAAGGGFAAYTDGCPEKGIFISEFPAAASMPRIFQTRKTPVEK